MTKSIETRLATLEKRVKALEGGRSGRKALPILVSEHHVCGIDPDSDSKTCEHASLYRNQKGCRGDACVAKMRAYYREYRAEMRDSGSA